MPRPTAGATKSRRPRRRFDEDFKAQAVRLVLDEGKSVGAASRDLDLTESSLRKTRQSQAGSATGPRSSSARAGSRISRDSRFVHAVCRRLVGQRRERPSPDVESARDGPEADEAAHDARLLEIDRLVWCATSIPPRRDRRISDSSELGRHSGRRGCPSALEWHTPSAPRIKNWIPLD